MHEIACIATAWYLNRALQRKKEIYIHLPAASPLSSTSWADSIGIDFDGAGQWDSFCWHDTYMLSSSGHSSWRNFCIPRRWIDHSACHSICPRKQHIQYAVDSVQNSGSALCRRHSLVLKGVLAGWGSAECAVLLTPPAVAPLPAELLDWGRSEVLRPRLPADLARR